jgi:hypothetical protein
MATLIEVFEVLRSRGLCRSQADFSRRFLGRSDSYLAYLIASQKSCCPVSLQLLAERLQRHAEDLRHPAPVVGDIATIMALRELHGAVCSLSESSADAGI